MGRYDIPPRDKNSIQTEFLSPCLKPVNVRIYILYIFPSGEKERFSGSNLRETVRRAEWWCDSVTVTAFQLRSLSIVGGGTESTESRYHEHNHRKTLPQTLEYHASDIPQI